MQDLHVNLPEQLALVIVARPSSVDSTYIFLVFVRDPTPTSFHFVVLECIVSESRRNNRPRGPKPGAKGKRHSTFHQDRNFSPSDFQGGSTGSLQTVQSPEPIENYSAGVHSTMPNQTPGLVPHPIPNPMNDHEHYATAYNVATSSPWYNYETQNYDYYGEQVEAGNSNGVDSWGMEGRSGNNQFDPSLESYLTHNTWDGSVSFTEPQPYITDDGFQQGWNYTHYQNL
ncbi:hypothetical protein GG344DRAFT_72646 [Lentinula edodes]|nr:hypothetical protein GG344DRAFT_72646 [Lentinula edodes]